MTGHDRWKTVLAYAAGVTILSVSLILALFFPGWYGMWQDEQLTGRVILESRENIEFLDGDSLDIAGRMKKLGEAASFVWALGYTDIWYDDWSDFYINQKENIERCRNMIGRWWEAGLLPVDCRDWMDETYHLLLYDEAVLYVNESALPVCFLAFGREEMETEYADLQEESLAVTDEDEVDLLLVLMDAEKDLIYYASIAGRSAQECMLLELGYEGKEALIKDMETGGRIRNRELELSAYDFAAVCGAESASITAEPGQLEMLVSLKYDNFEAYAGRSLVCNEGGYGEAVFFGTPRWPGLIKELLVAFGSNEQLMSTDIWCDLLFSQTRTEEALDILANTEIEGGVNDAVFQENAQSDDRRNMDEQGNTGIEEMAEIP